MDKKVDSAKMVAAAQVMAKDISIADQNYIAERIKGARNHLTSQPAKAIQTLEQFKKERPDLFDKEAETLLALAEEMSEKEKARRLAEERVKREKEEQTKKQIEEQKKQILNQCSVALTQASTFKNVGRYDQAEEILRHMPSWGYYSFPLLAGLQPGEEYSSLVKGAKEMIEEIEAARSEEKFLRTFLAGIIGGFLGPWIWNRLGIIRWADASISPGYLLGTVLIDSLVGGLSVWYLTVREESAWKLEHTNSGQRLLLSGGIGAIGGTFAIPIIAIGLAILLLASCS